jgi:hypothetical protein
MRPDSNTTARRNDTNDMKQEREQAKARTSAKAGCEESRTGERGIGGGAWRRHGDDRRGAGAQRTRKQRCRKRTCVSPAAEGGEDPPPRGIRQRRLAQAGGEVGDSRACARVREHGQRNRIHVRIAPSESPLVLHEHRAGLHQKRPIAHFVEVHPGERATARGARAAPPTSATLADTHPAVSARLTGGARLHTHLKNDHEERRPFQRRNI